MKEEYRSPISRGMAGARTYLGSRISPRCPLSLARGSSTYSTFSSAACHHHQGDLSDGSVCPK